MISNLPSLAMNVDCGVSENTVVLAILCRGRLKVVVLGIVEDTFADFFNYFLFFICGITWHCNRRLEEATGLAFKFVIGRTNDKSKMAELKKEVAEYDDFLLLDLEEEYSKLPYKTLVLA